MVSIGFNFVIRVLAEIDFHVAVECLQPQEAMLNSAEGVQPVTLAVGFRKCQPAIHERSHRGQLLSERELVDIVVDDVLHTTLLLFESPCARSC
jgi:hypothetical protein